MTPWWSAGGALEGRSQAVPGPDAGTLVLPRPGEGTAGMLQRSTSAGADKIYCLVTALSEKPSVLRCDI